MTAGTAAAADASLEARLLVRSMGMRLPPRFVLDGHAHPWPQLVFAREGLMSVRAGSSSWVVPPARAVWVPAGVEHAIEMIGPVTMQTIYVRPELARTLPDVCRVLEVPGLLREIVLEVVRRQWLDPADAAQARLAAVLVDRLADAPEVALELTWPTDARAVALAERLHAQPANNEALVDLAPAVGASPRTLERLFARETGLSFGRWRQRARLLFALRRLGESAPIGTVAYECGYANPSAFISMFKRALGLTPGQYVAARVARGQ